MIGVKSRILPAAETAETAETSPAPNQTREANQ
jgi:hypothetical protein